MSDDIVKRLLIQDEVGLFDLPDSFHVVDYGDAADEIERLRARIAALEGALEGVMVGGNHLVSIIGVDHPLYIAAPDYALAHYGAGEKYDAWCCWHAIMHARAALAQGGAN